jgi:hypothetical protein
MNVKNDESFTPKKAKAVSMSAKEMELQTTKRLQAEQHAKEWKHEFYGQGWTITKENTRLRKLRNESKKTAEVGVQDDINILIGEKRCIEESEEFQRPQKKSKTETPPSPTTTAPRRSGRVAKKSLKALEIEERTVMVTNNTTLKPRNAKATEKIKRQAANDNTVVENESDSTVCNIDTATVLETNDVNTEVKQVHAIVSQLHESETANVSSSSSSSSSAGASTPLTLFTPSASPDPKTSISYILNNNTHITAPAILPGAVDPGIKARRLVRFRVTHAGNSPPWAYVTSERWEKIKAGGNTTKSNTGDV